MYNGGRFGRNGTPINNLPIPKWNKDYLQDVYSVPGSGKGLGSVLGKLLSSLGSAAFGKLGEKVIDRIIPGKGRKGRGLKRIATPLFD